MYPSESAWIKNKSKQLTDEWKIDGWYSAFLAGYSLCHEALLTKWAFFLVLFSFTFQLLSLWIWIRAWKSPWLALKKIAWSASVLSRLKTSVRRHKFSFSLLASLSIRQSLLFNWWLGEMGSGKNLATDWRFLYLLFKISWDERFWEWNVDLWSLPAKKSTLGIFLEVHIFSL